MGPCYRKKSIRDVEVENKRILMRYYVIRCNALGSCSHAPLLLLGYLDGGHGSNFTHFRLLSVLSYASCKCIEVWTQRTWAKRTCSQGDLELSCESNSGLLFLVF